jgi:hypothetical protein
MSEDFYQNQAGGGELLSSVARRQQQSRLVERRGDNSVTCHAAQSMLDQGLQRWVLPHQAPERPIEARRTDHLVHDLPRFGLHRRAQTANGSFDRFGLELARTESFDGLSRFQRRFVPPRFNPPFAQQVLQDFLLVAWQLFGASQHSVQRHGSHTRAVGLAFTATFLQPTRQAVNLCSQHGFNREGEFRPPKNAGGGQFGSTDTLRLRFGARIC